MWLVKKSRFTHSPFPKTNSWVLQYLQITESTQWPHIHAKCYHLNRTPRPLTGHFNKDTIQADTWQKPNANAGTGRELYDVVKHVIFHHGMVTLGISGTVNLLGYPFTPVWVTIRQNEKRMTFGVIFLPAFQEQLVFCEFQSNVEYNEYDKKAK